MSIWGIRGRGFRGGLERNPNEKPGTKIESMGYNFCSVQAGAELSMVSQQKSPLDLQVTISSKNI